jgi:hypothetical protein
MTGVLALAQGLDLVPYWPYATAFVAGIGLLALGLIAGRRLFGPAPSHGYVLDINAVRAHASEAAAPSQKRAA